MSLAKTLGIHGVEALTHSGNQLLLILEAVGEPGECSIEPLGS